jgi:hypothetical protein
MAASRQRGAAMPKKATSGKAKKSKIPKPLRKSAKKVRKALAKAHPKDLATKLGISGRSKMKKKKK